MSKARARISLDALKRILDLPQEYELKKVSDVKNEAKNFEIVLESNEIPEDAEKASLTYVGTPDGIEFQEVDFQ